MKKIAREVLKMSDGVPVCIAVITGYDEDLMLVFAKSVWGKVHLFPCPLGSTVQECNKPMLNEKMKGYGGF